MRSVAALFVAVSVIPLLTACPPTDVDQGPDAGTTSSTDAGGSDVGENDAGVVTGADAGGGLDGGGSGGTDGGAPVDGGSNPPVWTCDPAYEGSGDGCDCGCGSPDPDCTDDTEASCDFTWCPSGTRPEASFASACEVVTGWTCDIALFGDGICDCGCGVVDEIDCDSADREACHLCSAGCAMGDCSAVATDDNGGCQ